MSPPMHRIRLQEINGGTSPPPAELRADGTLRLTGVQPGRYRVSLSWPGYVKSMQLGQAQFEGNLLDLRQGSGGQALGVLVGSAKGEISGTVTRNDAPVPRSRVALVWAEAGMHEQPVAMANADENGKYTLSVAPGRYKLAAVEEDDAMLWSREEDYDDVMVAVELAAGDRLTRDLKRK
jgi:hypothetical protein